MNDIKCPYCGKSHYREGMTMSTCMYFQPEYKDGININPDRNTITTECECIDCGKKFEIVNGEARECKQPEITAPAENINYELPNVAFIPICEPTWGIPCAICGDIATVQNLDQTFVICDKCRKAVMLMRHKMEEEENDNSTN